MKRLEALLCATTELEAVLGEHLESRQEAETLLQHCLGLDRVQLFIEPYLTLDPEEEYRFNQYLDRRLSLEPVPYILGYREFFGLEFVVNRSVLIPRPESELLVEKVLQHIQDIHDKAEVSLLIADIGTGSGCIAVSLGMALPLCKVLAIDISRNALKTARRNVLKYNLAGQIELIQGDLLSACNVTKLDIIVANLPYIPFSEYEKLSNNMLKYEPAIALEGGRDGLFHIRRLLAQASEKLTKDGSIFMEIGIGQAYTVAELARKSVAGAQVEFYRDLGGIERVVKISLAHEA